MARAKITIRVDHTRSTTGITYSTTGSYFGTAVNGLSGDIRNLSVASNDTPAAFWSLILSDVSSDIQKQETS